MKKQRVLAIGLDGYEASLGERLMAAGELPALARLRDRSARFALDHGSAQRTGLAWEHISSGLSPDAARRWAAVGFDPDTYAVWLEGTSLDPFPSHLDARTVVFDAPYFALDRAPRVRGLVGWGAHDPGVRTTARPSSLQSKLESRFAYPAKEWIYGVVWASPERARRSAAALATAVDVRAEAARWMLAQQLPDWDLALVVVSELHSAVESLWHGVDPSHPLHRHPSAQPAGDGLRAVYRAVDRLVGQLTDAFEDATTVVFATGGMGPNRSDPASMVLLPELLFRRAFGRPLLRQPAAWSAAAGGIPILAEDEDWSRVVSELISSDSRTDRVLPRRAWRKLMRIAQPRTRASDATTPLRLSLNWMPATRYLPHWRRMPVFALPSFYDGRVRINLMGRERHGLVPLDRYRAVCDEVEAMLRACRDPITGEEVVDFIERPAGSDPRTFGPTVSDLVVVWRGMPLGLDHPEIGRIGPVPPRRPGGHTGRYGMAYLAGSEIDAGDRGVRSTFDVVPTLVDLLQEPKPPGMSGESLLTPAATHVA